eukprot:SM005686S18744  [mRNA]  locus=s5686:24:894:- [translate_table: standard]
MAPARTPSPSSSRWPTSSALSPAAAPRSTSTGSWTSWSGGSTSTAGETAATRRSSSTRSATRGGSRMVRSCSGCGSGTGSALWHKSAAAWWTRRPLPTLTPASGPQASLPRCSRSAALPSRAAA